MKTTKRAFLLSVAVISLALSACATAPAPTNIVDTAARTPQLSTLSRLINEAGLAETLRGAGPFTVFAPSDDAFKAVSAKTLAELASDKALLKSVLTFHVVSGKVMAADVKPGNVKSLQGTNLSVANAGTFITVEDAVAQQADLPATNGVIHVIDRVLMPPRK